MSSIVKTSKFLSLVLRHQPEKANLKLDAAGWAPVKDLLANCHLTMEQLEKVVDENNKKRFAFNADKTMIRASQGHSVPVELGYTPSQPPEILYHGTKRENIRSIQELGLMKMSRHHVHLSVDKATAIQVGSRHGEPTVFVVRTGEMFRDGFEFFKSENGVWLTNFVLPKYLGDLMTS